jgi:replication fork protection complex subunit Csm3/Swi3
MAADPITTTTVSNLLIGNPLSDIDDDPFKDIEASLAIRDYKTNLSPRAQKRKLSLSDGDGDILGLNNEVKITKARRKIPKLDDSLLLSARGLPKLRKLSRDGQISRKLRLKGKGHEFSDAQKLLGYFQLWLDDLYPRAKFADALQMVEKAGHTKRMQIMRKEWIDEGKPGYLSRDSNDAEPGRRDESGRTPVEGEQQKEVSTTQEGHLQSAGGHQSIFGNSGNLDDLFIPDPNNKPQEDLDHDEPEDDDLDALLAENSLAINRTTAVRQKAIADESEGEDDLDALLADQDSRKTIAPRNPKADNEYAPEDDELDALLAEQSTLSAHPPTGPPPTAAAEPEGEDDLDALLAEQDSGNTRAPSTAMAKDKEVPGNDDLDVLLGEQSTVPSRPSMASPEPTAADPEEEDNLDASLAEQERRTATRVEGNEAGGEKEAEAMKEADGEEADGKETEAEKDVENKAEADDDDDGDSDDIITNHAKIHRPKTYMEKLDRMWVYEKDEITPPPETDDDVWARKVLGL